MFALGVDVGTSSTVAMLRWPDGRVQPLLFDGSPLLPSAVFAPPVGPLIVGRDALHHGRFEPAGLEPYPKRRIDEGSLLLGSREVTVVELLAAVLGRVAAEAGAVCGGVAPAVAVSYPAGWGSARRAIVAQAARAAGLGEVAVVAEPVAAANHLTGSLGVDVPVGRSLVIYDLGAGTFDASVVRRTTTGFEVTAYDGLDSVGGLDLDAAIVDWIGARTGIRPPADPALRQALWDDVRVAKEMLSRTSAVTVRTPSIGLDVPITRDEFEAVARPLLDRTVHTTVSVARLAGGDIAGVLRVGGGSRVPLAATLLHRAFGMASQGTEQPELIVAEGALRSALPARSGGPVPGGSVAVSGAPVRSGGPVPAGSVAVSGVPVQAGAPAPAPVQPRGLRAGAVTPGPVPHPAGTGGRRPGLLVLIAVLALLLLAGGTYGVYSILDDPSPPARESDRIAASLAGHWHSDAYGDCYIEVDGSTVRMVYTYNDGRVLAKVSGETLVGWWNQVRSGSGEPQGEVEFRIVPGSGRPAALDGRWRNGTDGAWQSDWRLTYVDDTVPADMRAKFDDASRFRPHP
jgi:actin-like ATPase involved in cell morphogenesis